jgi:hypothetical protein
LPLPSPVVVGDVVGFFFDKTCWPHLGLVLSDYVGQNRAKVLISMGEADWPGAQLVLALMLSHTSPPAGQYGQLIPAEHKVGTTLDAQENVYACYNRYQVFFLPGNQKMIKGAGGEYAGRVLPEIADYYRRQLLLTQQFVKVGGLRPQNVIRG